MALSQDFKDLLAAFESHKVAYMIVGGYAVSFYATPRFTKDIDLFVGQETGNLERAAAALLDFGAPAEIVEQLGSLKAGEILYLGVPPARVDIFRTLPGVEFEMSYSRRTQTAWDGVGVSIMGRDDLIAAKLATARPVDLLDVEALRVKKPG